MKSKHNPLSYLAGLGLLGVMGPLIGAPGLLPFLIFFFFLAYRKMPMDELFWQNVRKAAARGFAVAASCSLIFYICFLIRNWFFWDGERYVIESGHYIITEFMLNSIAMFNLAFLLGLVLPLGVFMFTLMNIYRNEKKSLKITAKEELV